MSARRRALPAVGAVVAALLLAACGSAAPADDASTERGADLDQHGRPAARAVARTGCSVPGAWSPCRCRRPPSTSAAASTSTSSTAQLQASTSDGCNQQFGGFALTGEGGVRLSGLGTTQAAVPARRAPTTRHIDAMYAARTVGLDDRSGLDQLVFRDEHERIVLVLQRIPPLSMGALLGTWKVVSLGDGSAPRRPLSMDFQLVGESGSVVHRRRVQLGAVPT